MTRFHSLAAALATTVSIAALATPAEAQRRQFNVPAGPLKDALDAFVVQSGMQLIYKADDLGAARSAGVSGELDAGEALNAILKGTGFRSVRDASGARAIVRSAVGNGAAGPETSSSLGEAQTASAASEPAQASAITVIGTHLKGVPKDGAQEVRTYSHEQIEASGQPSVARFLNTLPEVSQMSPGGGFSVGATNSVQLRGFPVGTTLVLLDGHRAPNSGFSPDSFDINNIPEGLLERVDILPLGSSAIYGSDALAGVVNFVLNRHLQGFSADTSYGHALHYSDRSVSVTAGRKFAKGDLGFGISYESHGALTFADRPFIASGDFSRFASLGGFDERFTFCRPGTVFGLSGNLPGLGAPFAAIPAGLTGIPSISDFIPGANSQNLCSPLANNDLVPDTRRWSALGYGDFDVTDRVHLYGTILAGWLKNDIPIGGQIVAGVVGASNPFNPFAEPVFVTEALPVQQTTRATTQFRHAELGLRGDLLAGWTFDLSARSTQDRDRTGEPGVIFFPSLNAGLASSDPATAINLFAPTIPTSVASSFLRTLSSRFGDRSESADVVFRGPLFDLPGGPIQMAFGGSYERQRFNSDARRAFDPAGNLFETSAFGSRHIAAGFAELRAPLLASFQGGDRPALAVSAAVRRDHFSDFGSATTPQFGLEFRPLGSLLLRATSSRAFRAPTLFDLDQSLQIIQTFVQDPEHGGSFVVVPATSGGNPNLRPETGRSSSLGAMWTSKGPNAATVSVTYWKISEHDRVTKPSAQALVDNASAFPGRVVRDATGNLVSIDQTFINFGDLRAEGLDFDASERFDTGLGELTPSLSATLTTKFRAALQPGSPLENRLNHATNDDAWAPRLKASASLGWHRGPFSASITARYLGRYLDYQDIVPNSNHLGGYALWDVVGNVALGELLGVNSPGLNRTELSITAVNLFNRGPQFSNSGFGYDAQEFDILGRFVSARLRLHW